MLFACSPKPSARTVWTEERLSREVTEGMSQEAVLSTLGEPERTHLENDRISLTFYFEPPEESGDFLGGVTVVFREGRVLKCLAIRANQRVIK